jgi:hypothetical protein
VSTNLNLPDPAGLKIPAVYCGAIESWERMLQLGCVHGGRPACPLSAQCARPLGSHFMGPGETQLQRSYHQTYCPYKGECAHYNIPAGGERSINAVWTYEAPYPAVSQIREYLAFYRDPI